MKNKKGFTLVELLVVIVLIGLLVVIAVPSGLTISKKVKQKMLDTKIEQIESAAIIWGQQNKGKIQAKNTTCKSTLYTELYNDSTIEKCIRKTVRQLVNDENALQEDGTNASGYKYLKNPINEEELNTCYVYIYIKNKRVYAKYNTKYNISTCYY